MQQEGVVKWFDVNKGFGFLQSDEWDHLFVHYTSIQTPGFKNLEEGQRVTFAIIEGKKGPQAANVEIVDS